MKPVVTFKPDPVTRRASRVAMLGLAGVAALTVLAGGLGLPDAVPGAHAAAYSAADRISGTADSSLPLPPAPRPPRPTPPTPPCNGPTLSVLDDQHQTATRLLQGETVTVWVTCFPEHAPVQILFNGEALATVAVGGAGFGTDTIGTQATFTMPADVPAGRYQTFTANFGTGAGSLQATYTVWYDYALQ